jgi:hypothetical protein
MSLPGIKNSAADEKQLSRLDGVFRQSEVELGHDSDSNFGVLDSERDFATHIISVHDDSCLNPWTLRAFVVGFGLSAFGGVLGKLTVFVFSSVVEMFEKRRSTTSSQYELASFLACHFNNCG